MQPYLANCTKVSDYTLLHSSGLTDIFLRGKVDLFTGRWVSCCGVSKRDDAGWSWKLACFIRNHILDICPWVFIIIFQTFLIKKSVIYYSTKYWIYYIIINTFMRKKMVQLLKIWGSLYASQKLWSTRFQCSLCF